MPHERLPFIRSLLDVLLLCNVLLLTACDCPRYQRPFESGSSAEHIDHYVAPKKAPLVSGTYQIEEARLPQGGGYSGTVKIEAVDGEMYSVLWDTSIGRYTGYGLVTGDVFSVAWGDVGLVTYDVVNNDLYGEWIAQNGGGHGFENLTGDAHLSGLYAIAPGTRNVSGKRYEGTVVITPNGSTYHLSWTLPAESYTGTGVLVGSYLAVAWGTGINGGTAAYRITDNRLSGRWAAMGANELGSEQLTLLSSAK